MWYFRGGSRIFFKRGCTRLLLYFNTNKPHSFCRIPVVLENRRSSRGGGGGGPPPPPPPPPHTPCTLPLDPPLHLPCLPSVYSSIFIYLQHTCKKQICANPFFLPVFNFLHRPVRENPSLPRDTFRLSKDIAPQRCENLKTFVVWWGQFWPPAYKRL